MQHSAMSLPNLLSLSRVPILFITVGMLYMSWPGAATLAFLLYWLACLTDLLDGYFARKQGLVSNWGKIMDALTDKIFIVGMFIVLLVKGLLPEWTVVLILLIVSREFLITGLRLLAASNGTILAAEKAGKQKFVTQIISVGILMFVPVVENDLSALISLDLSRFVDILSYSGIACFILATVLTINSGVRYIIKYWTIFSGGQNP